MEPAWAHNPTDARSNRALATIIKIMKSVQIHTGITGIECQRHSTGDLYDFWTM